MNAERAKALILKAAQDSKHWNPEKASEIDLAKQVALEALSNIPPATADEIATSVCDRFTSELAKIEAT